MRAKRKPQPFDPEQGYERLLALNFILSDRISTLEESNAQLRAAAKLDPLPPAPGFEWMTVKHAMAALNYSQSNIAKLVRQKKLIADKRGGRVLISTASVQAFGNKKLDARTQRHAA